MRPVPPYAIAYCIGLAACGPTASSAVREPESSDAGDPAERGRSDDTESSSDGPDVSIRTDPDAARQPPGDGSGVAPGDDARGVTVSGSGFRAQSGRAVSAAVASANGPALKRTSATVAADGTFEIVVPTNLTAGKTYTVAYYVDANANGFCNVPALDVSGTASITAPASSNARVDVRADDVGAAACSYFGDFSFFFDSHKGLVEGHPDHNAYGTIADLSDHTLVGEVKYGLVNAEGELVLSWPTVLLNGHRYTFVLWTDDNGDGACGTDKKFIYQEAARPGNDPLNNSAKDVTATAVTADVHETFNYHHETAQNGANFCRDYFPKAHYP